ncbi:MAG: site-specific integrase, partial [Nitrososphaerota archaeon]|nr:site-specific integrase [Nitrososphaerota archaeon]
MPAGSKYKHLLEDQDVRRWYENLEAKSVITATVYLRTLGLYCGLLKTTPKTILKEAPSKNFRDGFTDFVRRMEKDGKAGSYIERFKKVILSWTSYNNLDAKLKVNIKGSSDTPTIANERVPSKDELSRIVRMASPRGRVSIASLAFSGL